jgi:hypothetical protein
MSDAAKEAGMGLTPVEQDVLVREKNFVKFERLLARAEAEGRIDGPQKCLVCGMRYLNKGDADSCCRIAP